MLPWLSAMSECYALTEQTVSEYVSHAETTHVMTDGIIIFSHLPINLQRGSTSRWLAVRGAGTRADCSERVTWPTATLHRRLRLTPFLLLNLAICWLLYIVIAVLRILREPNLRQQDEHSTRHIHRDVGNMLSVHQLAETVLRRQQQNNTSIFSSINLFMFLVIA